MVFYVRGRDVYGAFDIVVDVGMTETGGKVVLSRVFSKQKEVHYIKYGGQTKRL